MDKNKLKSRSSSLDIVRIAAVFTVLSVHFFLHNGFYSQTVQGAPMYIAVTMRTLFSVCVPLFIILTGYLMCKKTLSKKYYSGITKTLVVFVLSTIACILFKYFSVRYFPDLVFVNSFESYDKLSLNTFIFGTLDFTGANYSWYIEMYIGLFLIAPFLNLAYGKLKSKRQKQVLVCTFIFLTILPSLFNIFNFDSAQWWTNPTSSDEFQKLIPSWWTGFYPLTFYFTGAYLREYGFKIKTSTLFVTFLFALFIFSTFNFFRSYGTTFKSGSYVYWYGFEPYVMSVMLFMLITRIKTDKFSDTAKFVLWKISDLALGIYLISFIFDEFVYNALTNLVPTMTDRIPYYFVTVPIVFILSAAASAVMNFAAKYIIIGFKKLGAFIKAQAKRDDRSKWEMYTFIALMAAGLIFSFWKCLYGFGGDDEAFYLTIPHRLTLGDSFISDEWHLSQLSGFLLLPFVWLYTAIMQSTEGIMLAARILYIIFHAAVTCAIYSRLKKHGFIAVFGCVLYFLFTPFDIMAMSYNTMGLDLIALTGVLMGTISYKKKAPMIISGISFAGAVLCCPYLAAVYVAFIVCVIVHIFIKKSKLNKNVFATDLFAPKTFLWFSVGVFALAAVFLAFALSRVSINEVITNLPHLLTDPDHPQIGFITKIKLYFQTIYNCHSHFKYAIISYLVMLIVMVADYKRKQHRSLYLIITSAIVILSLIMFMPTMTSVHYNAIMYPMIFIGITSYILTENKQRELMASLFALGILYSIALCFSSNQYFYVTSMAAAASNIASFVFLGNLIKEMKVTNDNLDYAVVCKYTSFAIVALMIILQGAFQITVKANHCFWDGSPSELTAQISSGPAKGIITSQDNCRIYEEIDNDLKYYDSKSPDNILCLTSKTWTYLALDNYPYGTLSAWITGEKDSSLLRLEDYYTVNPDKKPKYIYIPKNSQWDFTNIYTQTAEKQYNVTENDISYKLEKLQ